MIRRTFVAVGAALCLTTALVPSAIAQQTRTVIKLGWVAVLTVLMLGVPWRQGVAAEPYPLRPIKLVVPYPAGGGPDILARLLGEAVSESLGQPVIIDNRAGASGNIGTQTVARANADGYTLLMCAFSCSVAPFMYAPVPFSLEKEFDPVILAARVPSVLLVKPSLPIKSVREFMEFAKANPNKLNAASSGVGSSPHLAIELLRSSTGIQLTHVPYKGSGQVTADLLGGQVDLFFDNLPPALPNVKAGKLRALAVTSEIRAKSLPDVPTFAESGYPALVITPWFGVMAPVKTPPAILDKLNAAFNQALKNSKVAQKLIDMGYDSAGGSRAEAGQFLANESQKWKKVIEENHIEVK